MRITPEQRRLVVGIDRRTRSSWDVRAVAHAAKVGRTTAAKILRAERGPRPKLELPSHDRRTLFLRRDVMWSSDYMKLEDGLEVLKTIDECSRYRPGWELLDGERGQDVVEHAVSLLGRMGRAPLVWKHDNGGPFKSEEFQTFLAEHTIISYPTRPRAPWTNGRVERDNQDVQGWLLPMREKGLSRTEWEKELDDGMLMLNYIKPRAVLGYRRSADVYFNTPGVEEFDRRALLERLDEIKCEMGWDGRHKNNPLHRRAVKQLLSEFGLYVEWCEGDVEAEVVNRTGSIHVSI